MKFRTHAIALATLAASGALSRSAFAADLVSGYTIGSTSLTPGGQTLFVDNAAGGGGDARHDTGFADWVAELTNVWNAGDQISLTGIAVPIFAGAGTTNTTVNGTFRFRFYDLGADNDYSGTSETSFGSVTATFSGNTTPGTNTYFVNFDTPLSFIPTGNGIGVAISNTTSMRLKIQTTGTTPNVVRETITSGSAIATNAGFRMSLAGTNLGSSLFPSWVPAGSGTWGSAANWSLGTVPDAIDAEARLGPAITAPATVSLDGNRTIGTLGFNTVNAYTIASGTGGELTMNASSGTANINVITGSHAIDAPVVLATNTIANVTAATQNLSVAAISGAGSLTKTGSGTLTLRNTPTHAGGTVIDAGIVILGTGTGTPVALSNITMSAAGMLDYRNAVSSYDVSNFTNATTGTIRVGSGVLNVNASAVSVGEIAQPTLTIAPGAEVNGSAFTGGYELPIGQTVNLGGTLTTPALLIANDNVVNIGDDATRAIGTGTINGPVLLDTGSAPFNDGFVFQLPAVSGGAQDLLAINGSLVKSGANARRITVLPTEGVLSGSFDLITYNGGAVTASDFEVVVSGIAGPTRVAFGIDTSTPNLVKLVQTATGLNLKWTGSNSNVWDVNTTANFADGVTPQTFYTLDTVTFDDTSSVKNVDLAGTSIIAKEVIVDTADTYVFTRTAAGDGLTAKSDITKRGTGKMVIAYNLDFDTLNGTRYTGAVKVEAGTLSLGGGIDQAAGNLASTTGVDIASGATLELFRTGGSVNPIYTFPITGSGRVVKNGNTATISGDNSTWTGELRVEGGQLAVTSPNATGTAAGGINLVNTASLRFTVPGTYAIDDAINVSSTPTAQHISFGANGNATLNGLTTFTVNGAISNDGGSTAIFAGGIAASGNLLSDGAGTLRLGASTIAGNLTRTNVSGLLAFNGNTTIGGTLAITAANGSVAITTSPSAASPIIVNTGGISMVAGTTGATRINLTNGILKVNYTGATPLSAIKQLILNGRDDDNTDLNVLDAGEAVIYSSLAADSGQDIGYFDNGTSISIRRTLLGDSNVDGQVNFADLVALAQNYNGTAKEWFQGDFNYDTNVNFADLVALAQRYNGALSSGQAEALGASFVSDFALAMAVVPEPMSLLCIGAASLLLRRRR